MEYLFHLMEEKMLCEKKMKFKKIPAIYIKNPYPFPEIECFVKQCCENYALDLVYKISPMKIALKEYLDDHSEIKAILIGARRSDPGCSVLNYFDPTDSGWPPCIRIHPIIDWGYSNIWEVKINLSFSIINIVVKVFKKSQYRILHIV